MLREFGMYAAVGLGDRYHVLARRMADHVASRHAGTPRPAHELDAIMDEFEELQRTMHARAPEVQASAIAPPPPPKGWDDIVAEGGFAALHRLKQEDPERFAKVLRDHQIAGLKDHAGDLDRDVAVNHPLAVLAVIDAGAPGEDWKLQGLNLTDIPNCTVDDCSDAAAVEDSGCQQLSPDAGPH